MAFGLWLFGEKLFLMVNNELFAQLARDYVKDSLILTDADGKTLWVNSAFTALTGYELFEIKGRKPGELLQRGGGSQENKTLLSKAIKSKTSCSVDLINYTKSGEEYLTEVNISPILGDDKEVLYFIGTQRDVTSQRTQFQESIDFRAYQRALEEQAIVSVANARGDITYVNQKFIDISGYTSNELLGKNHRIINSRTHKPSFFKKMWQEIKRGNTWSGEVCNRSKVGELYWVDTTIVPVKGPDGKVLRYVSIRYDITERTKIYNELKLAVISDKSTGLLNREGFYSVLSDQVAMSKNQKGFTEFFLIKLGIDQLKELNDSLGHQYGDILLQKTAQRLIETSGESATVARVGGDEFAVIVSPDNLDHSTIEGFVKRLHTDICAPVELREGPYNPSCSVGLVAYPRDAETIDELLINVDLVFYEAKKTARNQCLFFNAGIKEKLEHKKHIKDLLLQAVDEDLFSIVMQPIFDLKRGQHVGFEILVRLSYKGESIPPDVFIPLAEELGIISQIGDIVFHKAMQAYCTMSDKGLSPGKIAINFSPPQFMDVDMVDCIKTGMNQYNIPYDKLVVEITETAFIGSLAKAVGLAISELQLLGVDIALDDFGTGFSSLSHLREFNVNKIKIDKSFINDIEVDANDLALVEGLVSLAFKLGLDVVAEGVETEAQLALLRDCQCQYIQGYYHSRPLTLEQAIEFLSS